MTPECAGSPCPREADYATRYIGQVVTLEIDRPLGSAHPTGADFLYELNYGYVPNTVAPDGDEVDAYVLGLARPVATFSGRCVAVIRRTHDDDDKLIVVPDGLSASDADIQDATRFCEQYFESVIER